MKNTRTGKSIIAFLLTIFICNIKGDACGGLLESDAGEFDLPSNYNGDGDLQCVWVIQLLSRSSISFTLTRLDSTSATVSLYPEHEASETVLTPIRLSNSDTGRTTETTGQTLIVVLTRSNSSAGLAFTWDSVSSATSDVLTAVNYVDSGEGRVLWNRFNRRERLTWALNLPSKNSLRLKAETVFGRCEMINPCWCTYFGIYELTTNGDLREVTRVCGRSSTFETEELYSKLFAFVYINSTASVDETDHVELTWSSSLQSVTEDPWQPSEATTEAPAYCPPEDYPGYDVISLDCGGIVEIPNLPDTSSYLVEYKSNGTDREHCVWTLSNIKDRTDYMLKVRVTLLCEGPSDSDTAFSVLDWKWSNFDNHLASNDLSQNSSIYVTNTSISWDYKLFLSYTSSNSFGSGFLALIEVLLVLRTSTFSSFHYDTPQGVETFSALGSGHHFSIVVNPDAQARTTFTVNYLDSGDTKCFGHDTLDVFKIRPRTQPYRLDRLCGNVSSPSSYNTTFPILSMFTTANSTNGRGFQISWD